jgi:hypothetical protein
VRGWRPAPFGVRRNYIIAAPPRLLELHLQGEGGRHQASRARTRRPLRSSRIGTQGGRAATHHWPADRRDDRRASLGRSIRRSAPHVLEADGAQFRVAGGVLDCPMPEPSRRVGRFCDISAFERGQELGDVDRDPLRHRAEGWTPSIYSSGISAAFLFGVPFLRPPRRSLGLDPRGIANPCD